MDFSDATDQWADRLQTYVERLRADSDEPVFGELSDLQEEQRRVTGGSLMQFLRFLQGESAFEHFPILEEQPIDERLFVFATDRAGAVAAHDIIDDDSTRALVVLKEEWRRWLDDPTTDADESYTHHYQYWSAWHRNLQAGWDVDRTDELDYWVHEEGFALGERAGRGSRHLWVWQEGSLELVEQDVDQWVSSPDADQ